MRGHDGQLWGSRRFLPYERPSGRHSLVMDALARVCKTAGVAVEREVGFVGKERPADLLLKGLKPQPLAVDGTVVAMAFDESGDRWRPPPSRSTSSQSGSARRRGSSSASFECPPMGMPVQKHRR